MKVKFFYQGMKKDGDAVAEVPAWNLPGNCLPMPISSRMFKECERSYDSQIILSQGKYYWPTKEEIR